MAIWAGSSINTNETANLINQFWNAKAIPMIRRKNGFLYAILGKEEAGSTPMSLKFSKEQKVSGQNVQFNLLGSLKTIATVADGYASGAGETGTWTGTVIPANTFGGITLPLVHFADAEYFPSSELDRFQGDELRTRDWIAQKMEYLMLSYEDTLGTMLNTTTAAVPTRTQICPWRHQISDYASTGESTYQTYGLDRSDSGNADFRGNVTVSVGDLTLSKIQERILTAQIRGGNIDTGLANTTVYNKVMTLVRSYVNTTYQADWDKFAGQYVQFGAIKFILESRMGTDLLGGIDSSTWVMWNRTKNFTSDGIVRDPSRKATRVLNWEYWTAIYCNKVNSNFLMTGITS